MPFNITIKDVMFVLASPFTFSWSSLKWLLQKKLGMFKPKPLLPFYQKRDLPTYVLPPPAVPFNPLLDQFLPTYPNDPVIQQNQPITSSQPAIMTATVIQTQPTRTNHPTIMTATESVPLWVSKRKKCIYVLERNIPTIPSKC